MTTLSPEERQARIAERLAGAGGGYFVLFRGHYRELPVANIPIEWPVYRAANGRLIMQLQGLQQRTGWSAAELRAHQEETAVQQQLHDLLLEMARSPEGPIYQELARLAQQTEPLLVTADGEVVNGNRRLAAMRDLLARDPEAYAGFQEVRVAVLPAEATTEDVEYIESALQLAPETKLGYNWLNRRLKLRRQRDELGLPVDAIIDSYRLEGEAALEQELQELALAEAYLAEYLGTPGDYEAIEDAEDLFIGLNATLQEPALQERDLWRWAGFAMIHARAGFKLKNRFPFAPPQPAYAPGRALLYLAVDEGLMEQEALDERGRLNDREREQLAALLADRQEAARLTRALTDTLDQIRLDHNEQEAPRQLLKHVQGARRLAERLEAGRVPDKLQAEIASEMAAIQHHFGRLLGDDPVSAPPPISRRTRKWRKLRHDPYRYFDEARHPAVRRLRGLFTPRERE